jgi:XTP/dITP diphosphohydrolase
VSVRPFELLVGTKNRHKAAEIRRLLIGLSVQVLDLSAFDELPDIAEEGETFEENAVAKASGFARMTGLPAIADDSGIEIDALGGRPGVFSARFAGPQVDDDANNALLLEMLAKTPPFERTARYRCVIAFATPEKSEFTCEGSVEGVIMPELRGTNGFGYDPLFFVPQFGATFGQLPPEVKDRVSHRARALAQFRRLFADFVSMHRP